MRISGINQTTSFGRIIKIHTSAPQLTKQEQQQATKEIVDVLNGKKSTIYSNSDAVSIIRPYFKNILGDYNGKNGVLIQKHYDENYLVSGEEAKQISELKEAVDMNLMSNKKAQKQIDKIFRENVENGEEDANGVLKPDSIINIYNNKPNLKANSIYYYSFIEQDERCISNSHITYIK